MRVLVTGAAGRIGRRVVPGLIGVGHDVTGIDRRLPDEPWADLVTSADLGADEDPLPAAMEGVDAVVHLAAIAGESDFASAVDSHLRLTHRVLDGCRLHGIGRAVYASSNHAVGFTPRAPELATAIRARPDSFYGFGKAAAEALCSLYHDRHGIEVACLRIGSFRDTPTTRRHLSTWLSVDDGVRLVDACLGADPLGFAIVYGISDNRRAWWDLAPGRAIGYDPADDAEDFAAEIESTPPTPADELDARYVGGEFTHL